MSNLLDAPPAIVRSVSRNQQQLAAWARVEKELMALPGNRWEPSGLIHLFAPGIYIREIHMDPGYVLGAQHKGEHFNIILKGRVSVYMDGEWRLLKAPCTLRSGVDCRKFLLVHEKTVWQTVHPNPTNETDIEKLEDSLFVFTRHYLRERAKWQASKLKEGKR